MNKPIAVLISDVHYSLATLALADTAMRRALNKANDLRVPLIVAGDLHDTKALHRAECQEAMLDTFHAATQLPIVLVGNHDRRNEKSPEHALHFLAEAAVIIDRPTYSGRLNTPAMLIPYQHDAEDFKAALDPKIPLVICHQGLIGADMGHYAQDKSAITKDDVANYRVISGHYHRRQDIKCGRPRKGAVGLYSYLGNPYSLSFGEANDPQKGFSILMDNGLLEFVPTNLRRHVIIELTIEELSHPDLWKITGNPAYHVMDLLWLKVSGTRSQLASVDKQQLGYSFGRLDFKLDKIPTDSNEEPKVAPDMSPSEAMDAVIDATSETDEQKAKLKELYRELMS